MDLKLLFMFVNSSKVGGYARAAVASLLAMGIAKYPGLSGYLDAPTQAALGVAVSGVVVGIWSHLAKKYGGQ